MTQYRIINYVYAPHHVIHLLNSIRIECNALVFKLACVLARRGKINEALKTKHNDAIIYIAHKISKKYKKKTETTLRTSCWVCVFCIDFSLWKLGETMNTKLQLNKIHGSCLCSFFLHRVFPPLLLPMLLLLLWLCVCIAGFVRFVCLFRVKCQRFGSCAYLVSIQFMNDKVEQCCFTFWAN